MTRLKLHLLTLIVAGLAAVSFMAVISDWRSSQSLEQHTKDTFVPTSRAYILPLSEPSFIPILDTSVPRPAINAKSAVVYDIRSGRTLYEKNSRDKLPIASLTKILSAIVVLENVNQDEVVTVPESALKADGEKQTLYLNERIIVENLLKLMLVESSNDAAYALAGYVQSKGIDFVSKMNEKAAALGMLNSQFLDPAGLDDNAFSTAEDLIKLARYSLRYEKLWNFTREKELAVASDDGAIIHRVKNTDILLDAIPGIVGGKTGYTDGALGCMILVVRAQDQNDGVISVVLGSGERFADTKKLVEWVKTAYQWR